MHSESDVVGVLHEGERDKALRTHEDYPHELLETTRRLRQLLEISVFDGVWCDEVPFRLRV